jgi:DNA-binding NarL/FixJ family response regulator
VVAIRVLLADDSEDILAELREDLSKEFDIVGTARNGEEAVQAVLHVDPDVLVIDIACPF